MQRLTILILMVIGSYAGSLVPMLWGDNMFSLSSIFLGAIGAFAGIWLGFRINQNIIG